MIIRFLPVALALGLCGCGVGYTFSPYVGVQQNWTTGPGGYVKVVDGATLYSPGQYPLQPYIILGAVTADGEGNLAKAVKEQHADAALISSENTYQSGTVAFASPPVAPVPFPNGRWGLVPAPSVGFSAPLTTTKITANLIKFK